jgi:hypothetical protein
VTNPWAAPDRAPGGEAPFGAPAGGPRPRWREPLTPYALAGVGTAVALLLLGAPVGLLWSAVSPHAGVVIRGKDDAGFTDPFGEDLIGSEVRFVAVGLVVGVLCGLLAWRFGRRWGPAVVVALALGGLGAAAVAAEVGQRPGRSDLRAALAEGTPAQALEANVRLRAKEALVAWPVGSLAGFLVPLLYRRDDD